MCLVGVRSVFTDTNSCRAISGPLSSVARSRGTWFPPPRGGSPPVPGDLGAAQFGRQEPEHLDLTVAERLVARRAGDQGGRGGPVLTVDVQQRDRVARTRGVASCGDGGQELPHRLTLVEEEPAVAG